jgi:ATP-binding cassette subfamily B protein
MAGEARLLAEKLRGAARQIRFAPRAWRLVRDAAGAWTFAWLALLALQGLAPVAAVLLTRPLVDALARAIQTGGAAALNETLALASAMAALLMATEVLRAAAEWTRAVQARRVEDHVSALIHRQATHVDFAFYEWPEFHDHLHRARDEARHRPLALLESAGGLLQHAITLGGVAAVLAAYGAWISIALVASTLPALVVVLRFAIRRHRWRQQASAAERRANYHDWIMTSGEAAAEMRLFDLGAHFGGKYQETRKRLRGEELSLVRAHAFAELAAAALALLATAACLAWMASRALQGYASLGDVALFYVAFTQGQRMMRSLLGGAGMIYYNVLFLGNLFEYLDLRPALVDPAAGEELAPAPAEGGAAIRFDAVSFGYPGSARPALRNLDLHVPAGKIAAIVGANGAGKSTLVKLLCRLYDPDSGTVEVGGVDLRRMKREDARRMVTAVFQQPMRYNDTVAGNIALAAEVTSAELARAAHAAGADAVVARLPQGYETLLGRWFEGGTDLSVGEWQRLALARAFLRRAAVIVLDEPTSAMDSWAEARWLRGLRACLGGRTALIVTHRFSTAMHADVIHVMDEGRVVESGTHAQLVARAGRYAQSWRVQSGLGHAA